ncbi:MAG: shikimate dehydrogenase [Eubacteriales bacterium]|nr:shikimate dehydrogenase [Eubacteriales bacterium]
MTSGKTRVCGVMAYPVEHSMSPLMHNYFAERSGVDLAYVPFKVKPEAVGEAVGGAFALNVLGMNVTVPHKQAVMEHLVEIDEAALAIGAVNTLVRMEDGYKGYNTDAAGLLRTMKETGIQIKDQTCILLGAGGAAKAAAYVLAREGTKKVYLLNRNVERAEQLAKYMNGLFGREVLIPMALDRWNEIPEDGCLAVQSTSVGMHPNVDAAVIEDEAFYRKLSTAFDIVYTPMETRFMKLAAAAGAKTKNGLDMLLYQGVIAFELWNPDVTVSPETIDGARQLVMDFLAHKK